MAEFRAFVCAPIAGCAYSVARIRTMTKPQAESIVLGIESSCDEMAAAIIRGNRDVVASVVHGQDDVHRPYGGVVPELASRDHVRAISQVVDLTLELP